MPISRLRQNLDRDGFAIASAVLHADAVQSLCNAIAAYEPTASAVGIRDLAAKVPAVRLLARSLPIRNLVESSLGSNARLVRSILFNKSEAINWQVAWHQDLAIGVRERREIDGFTAWSMKEGVPHVQPPIDILQSMLAVRLHLNDTDKDNGALWVSPGSHRQGRVPANDAADIAARSGYRVCAVSAGDALLLRPLTLHASRKSVPSRSRRVIHLEFAGVALPSPLAWSEEE